MKIIGKYSLGLGDRFGHQGSAQLKAIIEAEKRGIEITPVWNKSNKEHVSLGSHPVDVRKEADSATRSAGYNKTYFVDADHINLDSVDRFLMSSDYFTIDVSAYLGKKVEDSGMENFPDRSKKYLGKLQIPGIEKPFVITKELLSEIEARYLFATKMAGEIYRKIEKAKGAGNFITEISMDEVSQPQSPVELFFKLKMLGDEKIPLQTIAPKFSVRFNKGIDYDGDPMKFAEEFESCIMVIAHAVKEFGLPENLKMSIHSGSDKFSIYPHIGKLIKKHDKGLHLKTSGTTWLEEITGLALSGGEALDFVKEIYFRALEKIDELCLPLSHATDIDRSLLPSPDEVSKWDNKKFADSIRHNALDKSYNPNMRQLIHVAYRLAVPRINDYYRLLDLNEEIVSECVFENIYTRHICRIFDLK